MTNTEQLHQDFLRDFKELLQRYNARFDVQDMGFSYNSHRVPCIEFNSQYDNVSGDLVRDYSTIELPDYINPN